MSLSDAYVEVTCDGCHAIEIIQLTATARGYDERNVAPHLESIGWLVDGDSHYCEDCNTHHPEADMAQGEFTKEEARALEEVFTEVFNALPKSKKGAYLGHANDIYLFLAACQRGCPAATVKKK